MTIENSEFLDFVDWRSFDYAVVAGVDEVGRGCLAGPVYAAAVILSPSFDLPGITDSKLIAPEQRVNLAKRIKSEALSWALGIGTVREIEERNILGASLLAMRRAVAGLHLQPDLILIDGNQRLKGPWEQMTLVKGDLRCMPVSAASIVAKVERDDFMEKLGESYPQFQFAQHKGYGTPEHRRAIEKFGPTPVHRKSFAGVREFLDLK